MSLAVLYGISAGLTAAGGLIGGKKAKDDAAVAEQVEWEITQEELRRMDRTHEQQMGSINANIGGSGVTSEGTPDAMKADFEAEYQRDRAYTERVGASKAEQAGQTNLVPYYSKMAASTANSVGQMGKEANWWA